MDCIKVSVIIPVFNTEQYLRECLDSIVQQTLKDIEILCINDGSTDHSLDILKEYERKDCRVKVFEQENSGQSKARNVGIEHATGIYLYYMDSDDILELTALEELFQEAEKATADLIFFEGQTIYEEQQLEQEYPLYKHIYQRRGTYRGIYEGGELFVQLMRNSDFIVSPCLQFVRKSVLDKSRVRFIEGIIYEDNLYSLQLLLSVSSVLCMTNQYFIRRVRRGSTMSSERHTFFKFFSRFECYVKQMQIASSITDIRIRQALVKILDISYNAARKEYEEIPHRNLSPSETGMLLGMDAVERCIMQHLKFEFPLIPVFGFSEFNAETKIVIYGAGKFGKYYYKELRGCKNIQMAGWVAANYKDILEPDYRKLVHSPDEIVEYDFDYVVIAVEDFNKAKEIKQILVSKYRIEQEKILWREARYESV